MTDSSELTNSVCEPCRGGVDPLTEAQWDAYLPMVDGWSVVQRDGVDQLTRSFSFSSWMDAVRFTREIAALAEQEDHHPEITLAWGNVTVYWWTHKINGLHQNDFICAAKTNVLT